VDQGETGTHRRPASFLFRVALVLAMAIGSLMLWIGNPLLWVWLTSYLQSDGTRAPTMGPYALLLLGLILGSVAIGKGLAALNRYYERVSGTTPTVHVVLPWRRSLRGGRSRRRETDGRLPLSVLDVVMVISVIIAVSGFVTWLAVTNPTPPNIGGPGPAKH
jgi:hypothetical protein